MAPDFPDHSSGFPPLDHNKTEAEVIAQMFRGKALSGPEATRANFLTLAPQYAILHLATHAKSNSLNGDYAYLVLGKNPVDTLSEALLYVMDLYSQDWQADLAVLSVCETGIGSFRPGEGVISLGRGFAQAGVRSTVKLRATGKKTSATLLARCPLRVARCPWRFRPRSGYPGPAATPAKH